MIVFPCELYFGKSVNVCFHSFPVPVNSCVLTTFAPSLNSTSTLAGLLLLTFELSSHFFVISTFTLSSGILNVFVTLNPFTDFV